MNQIQQFFDYILNAIKIWIIVQPWQTGIRVRAGKRIKKLNGGIYFRIPYFDSVYIQENRLRVASMPVQTLTSSDFKTITINGALGYIINDIEKLYEKLYHPDTTIVNITMSVVADFIFKNKVEDIDSKKIEKEVLLKLNDADYGLTFEYYKVTNFAVVKTFRLIQDQSWISEGVDMTAKK